MAELKTQQNDQSVEEFLNQVADEKRRRDSFAIVQLMAEVTGKEPKMWGSSMVGFGSYHYCYASGREGDWPLTAFSPRKQDLTLYIMAGFERYGELLNRLGKHKVGKACLYIKRIEDIDLSTLKELIERSVKHVAETGTLGS